MSIDAYCATKARSFDACRFQDLKIRRYGFHGTSYKYVTAKTAQMLGKRPEDVNLIVCHLGAGSSMCCVRGGKSVDTTMGVTPLEGLVMASRCGATSTCMDNTWQLTLAPSTPRQRRAYPRMHPLRSARRCGDVDPAAVLYLLNHLKKTPDEVDSLLNKSSGLLGVCGQKDFRSILEAMAKGDARAQLAHDLFVRRRGSRHAHDHHSVPVPGSLGAHVWLTLCLCSAHWVLVLGSHCAHAWLTL